MTDNTPVLLGLLVVLLLALAWHEAAHAWVADRLGDPTARALGRVTLNPLKHLDPFLSVLLPVLMYMTVGIAFGGGKPVPVVTTNFPASRRRWSFMLVALAGPGSNLLLAALFSLVFVGCAWGGVFEGPIIRNPYGPDLVYEPSLFRTVDSMLYGTMPHTLAETWLGMAVLLNLLLAVFNLMPLPPLDGSRVIGWLLPGRLARSWYGLDRVGLLLVLGFFFLADGFQYVLMVLSPLVHGLGEAADWLIAQQPLA